MKKIGKWRIIYAFCALIFMGWMIHVGTNEFARINGQYRRLLNQLDPDMIRTAALEELAAECGRDAAFRNNREEDNCLSWSPAQVAKKAREIEERGLRAKERGIIKLVLFYAGFVFFFLLGPPVLIYLLLVGVISLYKNIKIVR